MRIETGASEPVSYEAALALQMRGQVREAEQVYTAFLASHPDHSEAWHGLGIIRLQSGRADMAVADLRRAVAAGGSGVVKNNLGVALCAAQRLTEAADLYREIVRNDPGAASALGNLGQILNRLQEFVEASAVLEKALRLAPGNAKLHAQFAVALTECGRPDEAETHFQKAIALDPGQGQYYCDFGSLLLKRDRVDQAAACFQRALSMAPGSVVAQSGLGEALGRLNRHAEAVVCFQRVIAAAPQFAPAYYNAGTALTYLGRMAEAKAAFAKAAELEPDNPAYCGALVAVNTGAVPAAQVAALEALSADDGPPLGAQDRMELQFTLAMAYDKAGDYAHAFAALQRGNAARRRLVPYDLQQDMTRFRALADVFSADFLAAQAGGGDPSEHPVFIVGMPRSGTTLVEQILASHPAVFGAGELTTMPDLIRSGAVGGDFPASVALAGKDWSAIGRVCADAMRAKAPLARRITDKLPLNFQLVGLIRLALPRARIVHVMRDPLDTCFSCYFTLFANGLGFADDLADLGGYYRGYRDLMAHWRGVLPPGAMLEIRYEDLVADIETEARRLIAYCGLDWDARCLDFHKTVRPVETASTLQVRRPLYRTSVGRAAPYRPWLGPLERALAGEA